jgi:hypothetical protein
MRDGLLFDRILVISRRVSIPAEHESLTRVTEAKQHASSGKNTEPFNAMDAPSKNLQQ